MGSVVVFPASDISTPLSDAYTVSVEERATVARRVLIEKRFDQAPALRDNRLVGWVKTARLGGRGRVNASVTPLDESAVLSRDTSVSDAIIHVAAGGLVFLAGPAGIDQFVVPSDLDKHAVRSHLYVVLSEIEFTLAALAREALSEREVVDGFTKVERRYYESARSKGRETHPVEYLYLGSYTPLIERTPELSRLIGWDEATREVMTRLNALRHVVAHPSASLLGRFDSADIAKRLSEAETFRGRLQQVR